MKFILPLMSALVLCACASHTPAPEPTGTPFPINEKSLIHIPSEARNG